MIDSPEQLVDVSSRTSSSGDIVSVSKYSRSSAIPVDIHASFEGVLLNESNVSLIQQGILDLFDNNQRLLLFLSISHNLHSVYLSTTSKTTTKSTRDRFEKILHTRTTKDATSSTSGCVWPFTIRDCVHPRSISPLATLNAI